MKISARQVRASFDSYVRERAGHRDERPAHVRGQVSEAHTDDIRRQLDLLPEERDIVVHELRARIRAGRYFVSGPEIVDAVLGRLMAGLIAD